MLLEETLISRLSLATLVLFLLLWGLRWLLSQGWGKTYRVSSSHLQLEDSLIIDSKRRLLVVTYKKEPYLLLVGPHTDCFLPLASSPVPLKRPSP